MPHADSDITYFARTTFRREGRLFGIRRADRRAHMYVIGKTGTGKSTLLKTLIGQDVINGEGLAVFDPHGDLVEEVRASIPERRLADLLYLNLPDPALTLRFNPLAGVPPERQPLAAANLIDIFSKIWADAWGPRLEHILRNACLTLLEQPEATLADIPRLFEDLAFRKQAVARLTNKRVEAFWTKEYDRYPPYVRSQAIAPVQNKVGAFLADPRIFRVLSSPGELLVPRAAIDTGKILLVNLSKGEVGEGPAALVGALLVGSLGLAGLARTDTASELRRDFYLYLDEFHAFATLSLAGMLSELRKYRVSLILAHQYLGQLDPGVRDAVIGNVGTLISFRVGAQDAGFLAKEFAPKFEPLDLISLPNYHIYLKLMIEGVVSRGFSAETLSYNPVFGGERE
jgi:energy-coupling factor transporter ATP-binding protein EcfA2